VLPTRRIFDADLEFLKVATIVSCNVIRASEEGCVWGMEETKGKGVHSNAMGPD
jgi:hypothetical protein